MKESINIIEAWKELNKINNDIELLEGIVKVENPRWNKLKEVLNNCKTNIDDKFINSISSDDINVLNLKKKYYEKNLYENYIYKELERLKVSDFVLAIVFLKDYKNLTWDKISYMTNYSERQLRRLYNIYKKLNAQECPEKEN